MESRAEFTGIHAVDVYATFARWEKTSHHDQGVLRTVLNGSFFTRDKLFHSGKFTSRQCPFCASEDSMIHRHWGCPGLRHTLTPAAQELLCHLDQLPDCQKMHGWSVEPPIFQDLRKQFCFLPDLTHSFHVTPPDTLPMNLFIDGSCVMPEDPVLRVATWAVVVADLQHESFPIVASGPVIGNFHTILRAELHAAIVAIRFALAMKHPFFLWTDNQVVYDRIRCHDHEHEVDCCDKDHDLWGKLAVLLNKSKGRDLFRGVVKVYSHQDVSKFSDIVEVWAIAGNDQADRAAALAFHQLPSTFLHLWERCRTARLEQFRLREILHSHFLAVGNACLETKTTQRQTVDLQWDEALHAPRDQSLDKESFVDLPQELQLPEGHPLEEVGEDLFRWLLHLRSLGDDLIWVTSYQMLLHYQRWGDKPGCVYDVKRKRWHSADNHVREQGFSFLKCSGWFQAALKRVAEYLEVSYHAEVRVPHGFAFRCWTNCVLIRTSEHVFDDIDQLLVQNGPVKSVRKALANMPCACPSAA
eukprot:Skav227576  [mRNA]  locus=scaffold517:31608:33188:- [translate_table: standard]